MHKRTFLKTLIGSSLLTAYDKTTFAQPNLASPIRIIIPRYYNPPLDNDSRYRLTRATLEFIEEKYRQGPLPQFNKPLQEIDLEKRLVNILFWIVKGIQANQGIYPLDPAWILAQIMAESFFYEFAVSPALAVGICQFIQPTAHSFNMRCAGDIPAHHQPPYQLPEFADGANEYYRLRKEKSRYRRQNKPDMDITLEQALEIIAQGPLPNQKINAQQQLIFSSALETFDEKIVTARRNYQQYISANIASDGSKKNIFEDEAFLVEFDERLTYKKPILSMTNMLARFLRARNGNILAASAGYNAGLSRTRDYGFYQLYGKIPDFTETTTYLSHILVNHHEILKRI